MVTALDGCRARLNNTWMQGSYGQMPPASPLGRLAGGLRQRRQRRVIIQVLPDGACSLTLAASSPQAHQTPPGAGEHWPARIWGSLRHNAEVPR